VAYDDINLRVPGPTPVPEQVALSGARPMVNHRGPEFAATVAEVLERLQPFFGIQSEPLLLTGSGTGAQEAAIVNMLSPGDEVLSVTAGVFGERFGAIAEAFGAEVTRVQGEWGKAISAETVAEAVRDNPAIKAVILTHNETSTGVTNDIAQLVAAIRREATGPQPVVLVDGVSSIGAIPFRMDEWDVDVAISGSQKAWMSPPGMAMVGVSERGWAAHAEARMPRFYWDFTKARKNGEKRTMPFTPAVGVVHAMQEALRLMNEEGPENIYTRHAAIGERVRTGLQALGLELFAEPTAASNTVTAVRTPEGIDTSTLIKALRQRRVVVANGQDWLKGSIFRIGHMGWVHERDIDALIVALEATLDESRLEQAV
jgi:aspartate aminotransferase-like enzyme